MLVILGLLVGGVLSGKSLIHAAEIRATIAQVDSLRVAARTFREKYFYLPGDIPTATASQLNLGLYSGVVAGDGDGLISKDPVLPSFAVREGNLFFVHLGNTKLLNGSYSISTGNTDTNVSGKVADYILPAKLGNNQHLYVWSQGINACHAVSGVCSGNDGTNYITIGSVTQYCGFNVCGVWGSAATLPTIDAHVIDMKVDDGMPQSGWVRAFHLLSGVSGEWAGSEYSGTGMHNVGKPTTAANPASSLNCFDNNNSAGTAQSYTVSRNNNTCALSFKM